MSYDEVLAGRVRAALEHVRGVEEKRMFGGITFMVGGKMCLSVGKDRVMCRIDPAIHDTLLEREGCRVVIMKGREYRGYVYVDGKAVGTKRDLDDWVGLALDYGKRAKSSKKSRNR
jgi:TfoX/Sxy family transcriptional regulator of competence genes